jgi:hypothetical protein
MPSGSGADRHISGPGANPDWPSLTAEGSFSKLRPSLSALLEVWLHTLYCEEATSFPHASSSVAVPEAFENRSVGTVSQITLVESRHHEEPIQGRNRSPGTEL